MTSRRTTKRATRSGLAIYYAFTPPRHRDPVSDPDGDARRSCHGPDAETQLAAARAAARDRSISSRRSRRSIGRLVAASTSTVDFADGEAIVRQGQPGDSMFVVCIGPRRRADRRPAHADRGDRAGGIFRRDVAADRRAADRHRRRRRRRGRTRDRAPTSSVSWRELSPGAVEQVGLSPPPRAARSSKARAPRLRQLPSSRRPPRSSPDAQVPHGITKNPPFFAE